MFVFGVEERQIHNICRLPDPKRGLGANNIRVSGLFVDPALCVPDPFGSVGVVFVQPLIASSRQLFRRVHDPEWVDVHEIPNIRLRNGVSSPCASFKNLTQIDHRLNLVQAQRREKGEYVVLFRQREEPTESIRPVVVHADDAQTQVLRHRPCVFEVPPISRLSVEEHRAFAFDNLFES